MDSGRRHPPSGQPLPGLPAHHRQQDRPGDSAVLTEHYRREHLGVLATASERSA